MKTILSLQWRDDWRKVEPVLGRDSERYFRSWDKLVRGSNVALVLASAKWFDGRSFTKYWQIDRSGSWKKVAKRIVPTVIHDTSRSFVPATGQIVERRYLVKERINAVAPMVDHPALRRILDSKLYQATVFSGFLPATTMLDTGTTYKNPKRETIVLKQFGGNRGRYVKIVNDRSYTTTAPTLLQEFVQAKRAGTVQDFRIHFIGTKPMYCFTRVAAPGTLYTNVGQGGSYYFVPFSKVRDLLVLSQRILERLAVFPKKELCLDFMREARTGKPFLIEANPVPGTTNFSDALLRKLQTNLTKMLLS